MRPVTPHNASRERQRFRVLFVVTVVVLVSFLGIFIDQNISFPIRQLTSDLGILGGGVAAAISCGLRRRTSSGNRLRAWTFLGLAGLAAALGNSWVLVAHLRHFSTSDTDLGNFGFAAALMLGMAALLFFPTVKRRGLDLTRILFDGIVVGGSLLSVISLTLVPQLLRRADNLGSSPVTGVLTVVADVVIATLAAMLIIRGARADRTVLLLLGSGGIFFAVSDLARAALESKDLFLFGGPVDIGWMAGYAAFALAARYPDPQPDPDLQLDVVTGAEPTATPVQVSSSLTFGSFLIAAVIRVARLPGTGSSTLNSAIWIAVLLAVTIRQVLLIIDNESLRGDLERRVADRTNDLQTLTRTSQTMLDSVGDGIYGVDPQGRITFVNPSAVSMLGFTESALIGAQAHDLFHAPTTDGAPYPYLQCYIAEAIRQESVTTSEEDVYRRYDGQEIPVEVTASPLIRDDVVEGAVVVFRDVTQRREVDRLKSEFIAVVSHELRTPMTSIRGSLGLLSAGALGELSPAATRMVKIALQSSERLTRLINDILDIERIESGTMPMEMAPTRCSDLVRTAVDQMQPIAVDAGVRLSITEAAGWVLADADRIVQTLVNLLGNSIKFSDPHSVVEVETTADPEFVTFRVSDQGRGIPADKLTAVFRRFEQVDSSDARDKGGTGLGLAISRSIVERHGGEITVESKAGLGSSFSFTIPVAPDATSPGSPDRHGADPHDDGHEPDRPDSDLPGEDRPLILVCDHDPVYREALSTLLNRRGYRTIPASEGRSALRIAREQQPRALLMDLMINNTDGAAMVTALRSDRRTQQLPIMVFSGPSTTDEFVPKAAGNDQPVSWQKDSNRTLTVRITDEDINGDVVLVEDDEATATTIRTLLERRGVRVSHARGSGEAVQLLAQIEPGVLIMNPQCPDEVGTSVLDAVRADERLSQLSLIVYGPADRPSRPRSEPGSRTTVLLSTQSALDLGAGRQHALNLEDRMIALLDEVIGQHQPGPTRRPR